MPASVLVVTEDRLGEMLGGAAIRAYEIARSLADVADVTLAAPGIEPSGAGSGAARAVRARRSPPAAAALPGRRRGDHAPAQPTRGGLAARVEGPHRLRPLRPASTRHPGGAGVVARASGSCCGTPWRSTTSSAALHSGHHFICSGRRQRDLYVGALLASRLIHPAAYKADPSFRSFLERVPFGIPSEPPQRVEGAGPRARFPAIGEDAQIVLWNGGIWNWLDPVHGRRRDGEGGRALPAACGWCSCSRSGARRP